MTQTRQTRHFSIVWWTHDRTDEYIVRNLHLLNSNLLKSSATEWVWAEEFCEESQRRYIQMFIRFAALRTISKFARMMCIDKKNELVITVPKDPTFAIRNYILKTFDSKSPQRFKMINSTIPHLASYFFDEYNWYPWKIKLFNILMGKSDKRDILWVVKPECPVGRTDFVKYMCYYHNAHWFTNTTEVGHMENMFACYGVSSIVMMDLVGTDPDEVDYEFLSDIKRGVFGYKPGCFPPPHLVVLADFMLDPSHLPECQQWIIKVIDEDSKDFQ